MASTNQHITQSCDNAKDYTDRLHPPLFEECDECEDSRPKATNSK